jgi:hypothetical protein
LANLNQSAPARIKAGIGENMIDNEWTRLLEHMRKTLAEREEFIQSVISDNVKLEAENKRLLKMFDNITQEVNHAD